MDLSILKLIASCDGCHAWGRWCLLNPEHLVVSLAGPISHTSTQYMDFVEIVSISLDLSTIYFAHFSGCWVSFGCSCHTILECFNLFSGVKLSVGPFCFILYSFLLKNYNVWKFNPWQLNLKLRLLFEYVLHRFHSNIVRKEFKSTFWSFKTNSRDFKTTPKRIKKCTLLPRDQWHSKFQKTIFDTSSLTVPSFIYHVHWLKSYERSKWGYYRILKIFPSKHSFKFILLMMHKSSKFCSTPCNFSTSGHGWIRLPAFKEEVSKIIFWILNGIGLLGAKFIFLSPLELPFVLKCWKFVQIIKMWFSVFFW